MKPVKKQVFDERVDEVEDLPDERCSMEVELLVCDKILEPLYDIMEAVFMRVEKQLGNPR